MQRSKLFILTIFLVMITTFAYSALATNLAITGEANFRAISDIRVTDIDFEEAKNGATLSYDGIFTKDTITNGFVLPNANSEISYNITIKNKGTIDQAIYDLQTLTCNNNNMIILIDDKEINEALPMIVPFGTSKTIKITYKTTTPSNDVINIKNKFIFKEVYYITYNTKGGTSVAQQIKYQDVPLTLEGTPTKSKYVFTGWTDEQNGTTVKYNVGSSYTENSNKIMYAIWRTGEATFLSGHQFAVKIKRLAGDTLNQDYPYLTDDANITSIVRANALPQGFTPTNDNIVSTQDSDFPIYAWYDNGILYYYTVVDNPYMNQVANNMFRGLTKVKNIDLSTINTSRTKSMHAMFMSCMELTTLDLSNFDTRNVGGSVYVEAMTHLFHDCRKLTSITFGNNFITDNVFSMNEMFEDCQKLKSLNLSNFNTSKVTNMSSLFNHCYELETITLGNNFTTSNVTTMYAMFNHNYKLTSINLSNFNTSKVTNMKYMFNGCGLLTSLDLSTFVTNNVTDMSYMFSGCNSIQSLDLSTFDMNKVTTIEYILTNNMTALRQLKTPKVYPSNLNISLYKTFYDPSNNAYTTLATGNPTQTWIKLPYTVKFNANNGTGSMNDQKIGVDATTTLSTNTFTRTGYTFAGWNTQANGQGTAYLNNASVTNLGTYNDEITLYAQWTVIDYIVTVDANGGSISSTTGWTNSNDNTTSTKSISYDSTYGTLPTPTRTGYTFKGWSNTIDSNLPSNYKKLDYIESTRTQYIDTGYIPKTTTKIELDLSFNGDFKDIQIYGGNNGFFGVADSPTKMYLINFGNGSNYNRLYPWFNKRYEYEGQQAEPLNVNEDIRTNRNTLTIENGRISYGTINRTISNKESNQDNSMYIFGRRVYDGYSTTEIDSGSFTSYNMRVYDMKVYENNVLIRHYIPVLNTTNHKLGLYETENNVFYSNIGTGEFNSEYTTNETINTTSSNHTLYAIWEPNHYNIVFDKNDNNAIGTMDNQTVDYDKTINLTSNTFTKEGYTFAGWNTQANGQGTAYLDGASVSNLTSTNNDNVTLYAQWIANQYTVTFDYNGNLLYGLDNKEETRATTGYMKYSINNGTVTVTALRNDGYGYTTGRVYLEANKTYIFNCNTNADIWTYNNYSNNGDVEAFLVLNGSLDNGWIHINSNNNYEFTPTLSGTYWLRLDVNQNGQTHTFSNISIKEKNTSKQVTYDSTYGTLPTPIERPGYVFKGWNGKNIFDYEEIIRNNSDTVTQVELNGVQAISWLNGETSRKQKFLKGYFKENTQYTFSGRVASENVQYQAYLIIYYTDDTYDRIFLHEFLTENNKFENINYVSQQGKTINFIKGAYNGTQRIYLDINSFQIEEGTSATTYETPYVTSSTNVTQSKNHTLKAIWEKKTATFVGGESFNIKIKTLAGNNNPTSISENTNITSIVRATNVPQSWIGQDGTITAPSDNNIVSTNTSQYPIYAWFNNGTVYYYTEALNPSVTNTYRMFRDLKNVTNIDVRDIDTSKATDFSAMFTNCSNLTNLDLSNFNTSSAAATSYMFSNSGLKNLDLSSFDLSGANPDNMLSGMTLLQSLKTPNTYYYGNSNVTIPLPKMMIDSSGNEYTTLTSSSPTSTWLYTPATFVNGSDFIKIVKELAGATNASHATVDTNITSIQRYTNTPSSSTLENAEIVSTDDSYKKIYLWYDNGIIYYYTEATNPYFNNGSYYMFMNLRNMTSLDINTIKTSKVTNMSYMFYGTNALLTLDLSNFNTSNVQYMQGLFFGSNSLTSLDISTFNMSNVTNTSSMMNSMAQLKQLKTPTTYPSDTSVTITLPKLMIDSSGNEYTQLTSISPTSTWLHTPSVFISGMNFNARIKQLSGTNNATYTTSNSNITSVVRANSLPSTWVNNNIITPPSDDNIVSLDDSYKPIYAWFDNGTIYYYSEDSNLYIYHPEYMYYTFANLESIDFIGIRTNKAGSMRAMFYDCASLTSLDLSHFDTSNVQDMYAMFFNNISLTNLNISNFNTSSVLNMGSMFQNTSLSSLDISSFNMSSVTTTANMFAGMTSLQSLKTPNTYPSDTNVTITLPTTLYDASGNSYSTLTSTSPTSTWLSPQYTITYDLDGGTVSTPNPTSYTKGSSSITLNNPTKTGYTFKGWSRGKNLFTGLTKGIRIDPTSGIETQNSVYATSDYISVDFSNNKTYYLRGLSPNLYSFVAIYDENNNFLGRTGASRQRQTRLLYSTSIQEYASFDINSAKYIRITQYENTSGGTTGSINDVDNLNIQLEEGSSSTPYEPYLNEETTVTIPSGSTGNRTYKAIWEENTPAPQNNQNNLQLNMNSLNNNEIELNEEETSDELEENQSENELETNSEEESDLTANINKFNKGITLYDEIVIFGLVTFAFYLRYLKN